MPKRTINPDEEIFQGKTPRIKIFIAFEKTRSSRQMKPYYHYYYLKTLTGWRSLNRGYRIFLFRLVRHDWQGYLNYLLNNTILGVLRYKLHDGKTDVKMVYLNEERTN